MRETLHCTCINTRRAAPATLPYTQWVEPHIITCKWMLSTCIYMYIYRSQHWHGSTYITSSAFSGMLRTGTTFLPTLSYMSHYNTLFVTISSRDWLVFVCAGYKKCLWSYICLMHTLTALTSTVVVTIECNTCSLPDWVVLVNVVLLTLRCAYCHVLYFTM